MNSDPARPSKYPRLAKFKERVLLVVQVVMLTLVGLAACGWILLIILGNFVWDTDDSKNAADNKPSASPTASPTETPIQWFFAGQRCSDGWASPSIGRQGACSHHGGVVTWYQAHAGEQVLMTLCPPAYQPKTVDRALQLAGSGGYVDCDFEHPGWGEALPQERPRTQP